MSNEEFELIRTSPTSWKAREEGEEYYIFINKNNVLICSCPFAAKYYHKIKCIHIRKILKKMKEEQENDRKI